MNWLKKILGLSKPNLTSNADKRHPCVFCLANPTWRGHPCNGCQEILSLWCPCSVTGSYESENTARQPMPDPIVSETCNRCGYRIKSICDAIENNDDAEVDRLLQSMKEVKESK